MAGYFPELDWAASPTTRQPKTAEIKHQHHPKQTPRMPAVAHHRAECVDQRGWQKQDGEHFDKTRERRGILEWMGAVLAIEPTAVRAQLFDRNL